MCIAILNTKGTTLKKDLLRNCWENNGDGAGMLYIDNEDNLCVIKEMSNFNNFYNNYIDVKRKYGRKNIVLHFRISTHGKVNETNCHPFITNDEVGFVHNGMIWDVPTSPDYSDTYMFNETILKSFKSGFETNEVILDMLELYIGSGSKLVFLNKDDEYSIVNEKAGHWFLGCWFSNTSYQQVNSWVDYGGVRKNKSTIGFVPKTTYTKPATAQHNNWWSESGSILDPHFCSECDIKLYGINEMNAGKCVYCQHEDEAKAELDDVLWNDSFDVVDATCELCESKDAMYEVSGVKACDVCSDFLGA